MPQNDEHPGVNRVREILEGLMGSDLSEDHQERVQEALDVMTGFCHTTLSVAALVAYHSRLERLARNVVTRAETETAEAIMRIGDGRVNKQATHQAVQDLRAALAPTVDDDPTMGRFVVELPREAVRFLQVLVGGEYGPADVTGVLAELADHAQQGVYRPGAWERAWLCKAFGFDWLERLDLDPDPARARLGWVAPRSLGDS